LRTLCTTLDETQEDAEAMHPASPSSYQSPSSVGMVSVWFDELMINFNDQSFIELDYGKNYRKVLYLMVKTMVSG
jgi:hypothetical protein